MEVIKHGNHLYDVVFRQQCFYCGADLLYRAYELDSVPEGEGVFCPECKVFLDHRESERIVTWLSGIDGEDAAAAGGTEVR